MMIMTHMQPAACALLSSSFSSLASKPGFSRSNWCLHPDPQNFPSLSPMGRPHCLHLLLIVCSPVIISQFKFWLHHPFYQSLRLFILSCQISCLIVLRGNFKCPVVGFGFLFGISFRSVFGGYPAGIHLKLPISSFLRSIPKSFITTFGRTAFIPRSIEGIRRSAVAVDLNQLAHPAGGYLKP